MPPFKPDWRVWLAIASLILGLGWLDVIRGRELAITHARMEWLAHEIERVRDRLEQLEVRRP